MRPMSRLVAFVTESSLRIILASIATFIIFGLIKFGIVLFLSTLGTHGRYMRIQDAITTGALSALAVWFLLLAMGERRQHVQQQLSVVADLNHELRNALAVILGSEFLPRSDKSAALLQSAERIEKTLDDLLPNKSK